DRPYDGFARDLLTATGDETRNPPVVWYKEVQTPEQFVDDVSQVFLGQRVACAQCHHHPYEKWGQDDYWGLAAFFGSVGRKPRPTGRGGRRAPPPPPRRSSSTPRPPAPSSTSAPAGPRRSNRSAARR